MALVDRGKRDARVSATGSFIGIVDPFLKTAANPGTRFWVYLYPRTITSLNHAWEHPSFVEVDAPLSEKEVAEKWLRNYAELIDETFNTLMDAADEWVKSGDYFYGARQGDSQYGYYYGKFEGESTHPDFWDNYELFRGVQLPRDKKENFFTCSC